MKSFVQILGVAFIFILLAVGCHDSNDNEFQSEIAEINFLNTTDLKNGHWIEIDGVRFKHFKSMESASQYKFSLPASRIVRYDAMLEEDYSEPFSGMSIGIMMGDYISGINKSDSLMVSHDHQYQVSNPHYLLAFGRLTFHRSDSTRFTINTSSDYPLNITTSNF